MEMAKVLDPAASQLIAIDLSPHPPLTIIQIDLRSFRVSFRVRVRVRVSRFDFFCTW